MRLVEIVATGVLMLSLGVPAGASPAAAAVTSLGSAGNGEKPKAKPLPPKPPAKAKAGAPGKADDSSLGSAARRELLKSRLQKSSKTAAGKLAPAKTKKKS